MRMLPFFKPKKGFMLAGGGLEASSGGGGGGGASPIIDTTERKVMTLNGRDVYARVIPSADFKYHETINMQDVVLCDKPYINGIDSILEMVLYEYSSNAYGKAQYLNDSDANAGKGIVGVISNGSLYCKSTSLWQYYYNVNNFIVIYYYKESED